MWRRRGTPQNFLLAITDEFWKIQKTRILKKWKKTAEDISSLLMCTENHNHMRYSSWDTKNEKMKISKKFKKPWTYQHFTQLYQNIMIIGYVLFLRYDTGQM